MPEALMLVGIIQLFNTNNTNMKQPTCINQKSLHHIHSVKAEYQLKRTTNKQRRKKLEYIRYISWRYSFKHNIIYT